MASMRKCDVTSDTSGKILLVDKLGRGGIDLADLA
jgi:hypothetical protein